MTINHAAPSVAPTAPPAAAPVTVAVHAPDPLRLSGLCRMLTDRPGVTVLPGTDPAADVLVVATDRLDAGLVGWLRRCAAALPRPVVLVVDEVSRDKVLLAVECRVVGVLLAATLTGERLAAAARTADAGGGVLPPRAVGDLLDHLRVLQREVLERHGAGTAGLTARELDVVRLLAEGLDTREIGTRLYCSERTVKNVISGVIRRLDLRNRSHVVAHALRHGAI